MAGNQDTLVQQDTALKNWTMWSMLTATERVVGQENLAKLLRQANMPQYVGNFPPPNQEYSISKQSHIASIEQAIAEMYGARGANTILLGIGKEYAKNSIKEFLSGIANVFVTANSFLPKTASLRNSVEQTIHGFNREFETQAQVIEENGVLFIDDQTCVHCMNRRSETTICTFKRGFLTMMLEHSKPGIEIQVDEVLCKARGNATCRYRIRFNT